MMMKRLRRWFDLMRVDLSNLTLPSVRQETCQEEVARLRNEAVRVERAEACIINILEAERDSARAELVALQEAPGLTEMLRARAAADDDYCASVECSDAEWETLDATLLSVQAQIDDRVIRISGTPEAVADAVRTWLRDGR